MAQRIFFSKPGLLQCFFLLLQDTYFGEISLSFSNASGQNSDKAETILEIILFDSTHQPIPIQIRVLKDNPWHSLDEPRFQILLR